MARSYVRIALERSHRLASICLVFIETKISVDSSAASQNMFQEGEDRQVVR